MGHDVYDFRKNSFKWEDLLPGHHVDTIHPAVHQKLLGEKPTVAAYAADMTALREADMVVMVCPCGSSAHMEAGWGVGAGKELIIYQQDPQRPDVMYKMGTLVTSACQLRAAIVDEELEQQLAKEDQDQS